MEFNLEDLEELGVTVAFNFDFNHTKNHKVDKEFMHLVQKTIILSCMIGLVLLTSAVSVLFGLIFWLLIPSWRVFRHYAFLNLLLSNSAIIIGQFAEKKPAVFMHIVYYIFLVFTHWLIVISGLFYFGIEKWYKNIKDIKYLYLKANMFGWLLPSVWVTIAYFSKSRVFIGYVFIVLVLINFLMYARVLFSLCKPSSRPSSCLDIGRDIIFATFAFIFTGILMYAPIMMTMYTISGLPWETALAVGFTYVFTAMAVNLHFLTQKVHREKWAEYQGREGLDNFI